MIDAHRATLKNLAGGLLGLAILAWVAAHSGPTQGEVVVHVTEPDVEVRIGGRTYRIEDQRYDPIVCELPAGWHDLVVKRRGRVLYHESFEIRPGLSVVLTAWDLNRDRSDVNAQHPGEALACP